MPSTHPAHASAPFALLDWKNNLVRAGLPAETAWKYSTEIRRFLRRCEMLQLPVDRRCVAPYVRSIPPRGARAADPAQYGREQREQRRGEHVHTDAESMWHVDHLLRTPSVA